MKRSKFSEAQVAMILRQADEGATIGEACYRRCWDVGSGERNDWLSPNDPGRQWARFRLA